MIRLSRQSDERGSFLRVFCSEELTGIGFRKKIVQINRSFSNKKGTVRGMHYQKPPFAEVKMITCLRGEIFDVLVDVRKGSPAFLSWHAVQLCDRSDDLLLVPEGVAHGFQTLTDNVELLYFHTSPYVSSSEAGIRYNDPMVHIAWPIELAEISERDRSHPLLNSEFEGIST